MITICHNDVNKKNIVVVISYDFLNVPFLSISKLIKTKMTKQSTPVVTNKKIRKNFTRRNRLAVSVFISELRLFENRVDRSF